MNLQSAQAEFICPREEIFAYVDGELSSAEELDLEIHVADCTTCKDEVNAQKRVSNSLEILLDEESQNIAVPDNFSKVVAAQAESDVKGLRHRKEISKALLICTSLFFLVTLGLGTEIKSIGKAVSRFAEQSMAVGGFVFHLIYDSAVGVAVIFRSVTHKFAFGSIGSLVLLVAFFALAFFMLSRLVIRYDRS